METDGEKGGGDRASRAARGGVRVSVIVPHFNDPDRLDACLSALAVQTYPATLTEIIIADNGSPQGLDAIEHVIGGRGRLVSAPEKGAGPARNRGAAVATGEALAFTDADCLPEPGWLAAGVAALARAPVIGGRMTVLVEDERRLTGPEAFERVFAFDNERYVKALEFSVTANLFCWKDVFRAVGDFRVGVSEDLEWCRRAVAAGYRLDYAAQAVVGHPARRTWPELQAKWRRINAETYGLTAGRPGADARWLLRTLLLPASAVAHTPRVLSSRAISGARQRWAALGTLYRMRFWRLSHALSLLGGKGHA